MPIGNKPLICYQIEYLERNGFSEIYIPIEKKYLAKVERYLKEFFKPHLFTEIELVILSDEEDSANVLNLLKDKIDVKSELFIDVERLFSSTWRFFN